MIPGFLGLEIDPTDSDIVWAAVAILPPTTSSACAVAKVNIVTGALEAYYDFSPFRSSYGNMKCAANDLVFDDNNNLYVTDYYGYQIFKVASDGAVSVFASDTTYLCNPNSGSCPPTEDTTFSSNGPNGIEYVNGNLIVGVQSDRMVRIVVSTAALSTIAITPAGAVQQPDGKLRDL